MASEEKMKELFETARTSRSFPGLSDDDVWGACLKYKDLSNEEIDAGIARIRAADVKKGELMREAVERGKMNKINNKDNEGLYS